jgi:rare lipoprotein A (peptidoglycan hydrolase)
VTTRTYRALVLAGVALLAAIVPLAITHRDLGRSTKKLPEAVGWTTALAAPYSASPSHTRTTCGQLLTDKTMGVAHPVLPCGVKLYIEYRGRRALVQVIDRGPKVPGRTFDVTIALARKLGLHGTQRISWAYAKQPS